MHSHLAFSWTGNLSLGPHAYTVGTVGTLLAASGMAFLSIKYAAIIVSFSSSQIGRTGSCALPASSKSAFLQGIPEHSLDSR